MVTERDWADAFLAQARADLAGAQLVGSSEPSVLAMLLQMTFEKFAKAALLRSGAISLKSATTSHSAASRMVAVMRLQQKKMQSMGGPLPWHKAFEIVEALERAHPAIAKGSSEQLEYPWVAGSKVLWPARDLVIAQHFGNPKSRLAPDLLAFAGKLDRNFDNIFGP